MGEINFSIIIPTFNRYNYLVRGIQSILNQIDIKENEIIIIDNSSENFKELPYNHRNIIHIKNEKSQNANFSRQIGINISRGEILVFLDDDDEWLPNRYEELFYQHIILNHNIFFANYSIHGSIKSKLVNKIFNSSNNILLENYLGGFSVFSVRKSFLTNNAITLNENLKSCQDWCLFIDIFKISPIYINKFNRQATIKYNVHNSGNITSNINFKLQGRFFIYNKIKPMLSRKNRVKHLIDIILLRLKRDKIVTKKIFYFLFFNSNFKQLIEFFKCLFL